MQQHVTTSYSPSKDKFPHVTVGETVTYSDSNDRNSFWFKGRTREGIEGFFPREDFEIDTVSSQATCQRNFDATELHVEKGDVVESLGSYGKWQQVLYNGQIGWIPDSCCENIVCFPATA